MTKYDVLLLGDLNVDVVLYVNRLPEPDEDVQVTGFEIRPGGVGYNTSVALHELGLASYLVGSVGDDVFGQYVVKRMREEGLEVRGVKVVNGVGTGVVSILVLPTGDRAMASFRGANRHVTVTAQDLNVLSSVRHVHVSGYMLLNADEGRACVNVLSEAGTQGISRSVDLEGVAFSGWGRALIVRGLVEYVFMNERELKSLTGLEVLEGGNEVHRLIKPKATIVKLGEEGSVAFTGSEVLRQEAYRVRAVDCTGAGDAFNAGFIYGTLTRLDLRRALRIANALGARKCCEGAGDACLGLSDVLTEFGVES
ncbi:MAG: carbohydrate kinase family protein [Zestosphaera sp.]